MTKADYQLEICVDSFAGAHAAEKAGAHRIELAAGLDVGGLTPSWGLLERAFVASLIDVVVLIRPRPGDFCFDEFDMQVMERDIIAAKELGVFGVALGVLQSDGQIDFARTSHLIQVARPLSVTFHRAFDMTRDLQESLDKLIEMGVDRVLTSGGKRSALEGVSVLSDLVARADEHLVVMPGAGIGPNNMRQVAIESRAREFHLSASRFTESAMTFRNERCSMGSTGTFDEFAIRGPDPALIEKCLEVLSQSG